MLSRLLALCAVVSLVTSTSFAADSSMIGTWKLNPNRSKLSEFEKIKSVGGNKYSFQMGTHVRIAVFDGKDYPLGPGDTWALTPAGAFSWKEVDKHNGQVTSTCVWTLFAGGRLLTIVTDGTQPDGSPIHSVIKAKRTAGSSGLAGTWNSRDLRHDVPSELLIQSYEGDGLSFVTPADKGRIDLKLDNKEYPVTSPNFPPGTKVTGKQIDPHTVGITSKTKDKPFYNEKIKISNDGRRLTATLHFGGVSQEEVDVYDRQ